MRETCAGSLDGTPMNPGMFIDLRKNRHTEG